MAEFTYELSERLGWGGEFNEHVQHVYEVGCKLGLTPEGLLEFAGSCREAVEG